MAVTDEPNPRDLERRRTPWMPLASIRGLAPRGSESEGSSSIDVGIELLTEAVLRRVYERARAEYPRECCGMIHASGIVRLCRNAQDEYHAADPDAFPCTSATGYCFAVGDQLHLAESLESGDPVRIVYHSHPDTDAAFSRRDREAAIREGEAVYPGLLHLVIEARAGGIGGAVLYGFRDGDFRAMARFRGSAY